MTVEEVADRVVLARRLRIEARGHRTAARRLICAAQELERSVLSKYGHGRAKANGGVIIAEHVFGATANGGHSAQHS